MFSIPGLRKSRLCLPALLLMLGSTVVDAAMDPRFELDSQTLGVVASAPVLPGKGEKKQARSDKVNTSSSVVNTYTVRQGDHLFKILMRDYGLNNDEAESFIEEIRRENNIYDIRRLKVGQKIIIPPVKRRADGTLKLVRQAQKTLPATGALAGQILRLDAPLEPVSEQQALSGVREFWNNVVPVRPDVQKPLSIQTATFSLTLDPQRYPIFTAMDNGKILLDSSSSIPPLVRSLISEKDPTIRIISESPASGRQFLASILGSAGFYSLEENFGMEFGTDPKISVQSDFKIEKNAESLIKQDIVLVNSGRKFISPVLHDFLKKEGFSVFEPFASLRQLATGETRQLHVVKSGSPIEIVDAILSALSLPAEKERRLDVFAADNNGISLSVKADRYVQHKGQRYIITSFDGDPVTYTLFRILETKGYRVVILDKQDDFRKVTEKVASRLKLNGRYARHDLLPDAPTSYSLNMSGFKVDDPSLPGGTIFLTSLELDKVVRDMLVEGGYSIKMK